MDAAAILTIGVQIAQIATTVGEITPELISAGTQWKTVGEKFLKGEKITEDQVKDLRARLDVLSAANAVAEDAIISGASGK